LRVTPAKPSFATLDGNRLKGGEVDIVQLPRIFIIPLVILGTASAQPPEDALRSKIKIVRYAPLAEAANIQGNVHVALNAGVVTLLSGPPLLAQTALESAKALGSIQGATNLDLTYHFVLVYTATSVPTSITVQRGNAFGRTILRMFGLKTEKVVFAYSCQEGVPPPNDLTTTGGGIEIWIYGRSRCLTTEAATLVAKR
jgi:hypothetical protein